VASVLLTTAFSADFRITLLVGVPFLALISAVYFARRDKFSRAAPEEDEPPA